MADSMTVRQDEVWKPPFAEVTWGPGVVVDSSPRSVQTSRTSKTSLSTFNSFDITRVDDPPLFQSARPNSKSPDQTFSRRSIPEESEKSRSGLDAQKEEHTMSADSKENKPSIYQVFQWAGNPRTAQEKGAGEGVGVARDVASETGSKDCKKKKKIRKKKHYYTSSDSEGPSSTANSATRVDYFLQFAPSIRNETDDDEQTTRTTVPQPSAAPPDTTDDRNLLYVSTDDSVDLRDIQQYPTHLHTTTTETAAAKSFTQKDFPASYPMSHSRRNLYSRTTMTAKENHKSASSMTTTRPVLPPYTRSRSLPERNPTNHDPLKTCSTFGGLQQTVPSTDRATEKHHNPFDSFDSRGKVDGNLMPTTTTTNTATTPIDRRRHYKDQMQTNTSSVTSMPMIEQSKSSPSNGLFTSTRSIRLPWRRNSTRDVCRRNSDNGNNTRSGGGGGGGGGGDDDNVSVSSSNAAASHVSKARSLPLFLRSSRRRLFDRRGSFRRQNSDGACAESSKKKKKKRKGGSSRRWIFFWFRTKNKATTTNMTKSPSSSLGGKHEKLINTNNDGSNDDSHRRTKEGRYDDSDNDEDLMSCTPIPSSIPKTTASRQDSSVACHTTGTTTKTTATTSTSSTSCETNTSFFSAMSSGFTAVDHDGFVIDGAAVHDVDTNNKKNNTDSIDAPPTTTTLSSSMTLPKRPTSSTLFSWDEVSELPQLAPLQDTVSAQNSFDVDGRPVRVTSTRNYY